MRSGYLQLHLREFDIKIEVTKVLLIESMMFSLPLVVASQRRSRHVS